MNMDDHYLAAPDRYQRQPYRAAGRHGLRLPGSQAATKAEERLSSSLT